MKANGKAPAKSKRELTTKARARVLKYARKRGIITNQQARRVGKWAQAWYHLRTMEREGYLTCTDYNTWEPVRRKGRPVDYGSY